MNKKFITQVSFVAALGGLLFGFDTAIVSGTIPYITTYFNLDAYWLGWAVSSILIGCAIGALLAGKLADFYGRRMVLIICACLFACSGVGAGLSVELHLFIISRIVGGLGVGAAAMVSPMYIAEIAPAQQRGRLVSFYQLAIVLGILLAYGVNYIFDGTGENNWRWMYASQTVPSILFFVMLLKVPETPRWLIGKGRKKEAVAVLNKMSATNDMMQEYAVIEQSFATEAGGSVSKSHLRVVTIGVFVAVFQQVTGINCILYYAPVIFRQTGLTSASSLLQTIGIGIVNVVATFIAIKYVDKAGRKKFLVTGSVVMGVALLIIAACFYYSYFDYYLVLVSTLIYVAAFGCTLGAVTWVYLSEIFPNRIRALALSVATLSLWLADFVVTLTFPVMTSTLGTAATFGCYAVLCVAAFVFFSIYVRETRGRSLEEIETLFNQ
jgi:SP family arabinose:H+ symporter-like MFS transporter